MDLLDKQLQVGLKGDFEEAWRIAQILEKERPQCNRAAFNRGWYVLSHGDLQKGFELLDRGRWEGVFGSPPLMTNKPIYNFGDDLKDKHLIIRGEGGLGDEIINVRFAKDFAEKGAKVIVGASQSLMSPFTRVEGVTCVTRRKFENNTYHDYWIPAMSAPRLSGTTYETLSGKPYLMAKNKIELPGNFKIGIRWSGNPEFEHEQHRKFPPKKLIDIHKIKGTSVYSFQKDDDLQDLPDGVVDLNNLLLEWEDTLNFLAGMDLVITSCTSIAHASGALGIETWVIVPILPYYIWALPGNKSPWYDSVTLYRQTKYGYWDDVFEKIKRDLKRRISKRRI